MYNCINKVFTANCGIQHTKKVFTANCGIQHTKRCSQQTVAYSIPIRWSHQTVAYSMPIPCGLPLTGYWNSVLTATDSWKIRNRFCIDRAKNVKIVAFERMIFKIWNPCADHILDRFQSILSWGRSDLHFSWHCPFKQKQFRYTIV